MIRTVLVKLQPEPEVASVLLTTLHRCNEGANLVSRHARKSGSYRKYDLQREVYQQVRDLGLSAQPAIRCISKTADAYKTLAANLRNGRYGKTGSPLAGLGNPTRALLPGRT